MQKKKGLIVFLFILVLMIVMQNSISYGMDLSFAKIDFQDAEKGIIYIGIIGVIALQTLISIILAVSLYKKSKELDEVYYEEGNNVVEQITKEKKTQVEDEPVAVKKLKEEALEEHPKAVQEMEDKKKIEEIQRNNKELEEKISNLENKILEDKKENEEAKEDKVTQNTMNFRHQKALDEFYKNAEEIEETVKVEKKSRSKGKHSM